MLTSHLKWRRYKLFKQIRTDSKVHHHHPYLLTLFFLSLSSKIKSNTSVYVGVIIAGALVGEKMVNKGFDSMWESRNKGKLFKDLKLPEAEEE